MCKINKKTKMKTKLAKIQKNCKSWTNKWRKKNLRKCVKLKKKKRKWKQNSQKFKKNVEIKWTSGLLKKIRNCVKFKKQTKKHESENNSRKLKKVSKNWRN